jgi:hypothetical protein
MIRQLITIVATKIKLSMRSLRMGDDVVSLLSVLLLVSLFAWSAISFMLGLTVPVVRLHNSLPSEVALWVAHVVAFLIFTLWTFIPVLTGFSFTRPLDLKSLGRFPISVRTCVIADTLSQNLDWGVLIVAPLLVLIIQMNGLTSTSQILFSVVLSSVFLNVLILLSSLLRALVMNARPGLVHVCSLVPLTALWLYVKGNLAGLRPERVVETIAADPVVSILTHLPSGAFIESLHCLKTEDPRGLAVHSLTLVVTGLVLGSAYTHVLKKRDLAPAFRRFFFHRLLAPWPDGVRVIATLEKWFPCIHSTIVGFAAKDIVYFLRSKRVWVWSVLTYAAAVAFHGYRHLNGVALVLTAGIPITGILPLAMNFFAFEGRGIRMYLLAPASSRQIIQQKNMVISFLTIALALPVLFWSGLDDGFNPGMVSIQYSFFLFHLCVMNIVGNCSSIVFACRVSFDRVIGQFNPIESLPVVSLAIAFLETPLIVWSFLVEGRTSLFVLGSLLLAILMCCGYGFLLWRVFPLLLEYKKIHLVRRYLVEEGLHDA